MSKLKILAGTTSKITRVFIQDARSTVGAGLTGLVYNSSGITAYYLREGAATPGTAISLVTATVGTWASGGFIAADATNLPGVYELHLPNAVIASGAQSVIVMLQGAANMVPVILEMELDAVNYQSATNMGLSALPTASAGASGGLTLGDGSGNISAATINKLTALVPVNLTVLASPAPTTTTFSATVGSTSNYADWLVVFNSGANTNIDPVAVTGFVNTAGTGAFTLENALPNAPSAGDTFYIVGADQPKELILFLSNLGTDYKPVLSANTQPTVSANVTQVNGAAVTSGVLQSADVAALVAAIFAHAIETGVTTAQVLEAIGAYCAGNTDGSTVFKAIGNSGTSRLSFTINSTTGARTVTPSL